MSADARIKVQIGGKSIHVPVYRDRETTLRLVRRVNERLKAIEADSDRIDTQAFALEAALSFAAELDAAEADMEAEQTEIFNELDRLSKTVDKLVREYEQD